jgi:hypothetical protein
MNLELTIKENISLHNFEWYKSIQKEFISYSGYDSVTGELEIEGEIEEDVPIKYGKDNKPIEYATQLSYQYVKITLKDFCWGIESQSYASEYIVLKRTFDLIINSLDDAVKQTGDISLKYEIIKYTLRLVKIQVLNLCQDDTSFSYRSLMYGFYNKLRFFITSRHPNISWIFHNFFNKVDQNKTHPEKVIKARPKQLKKIFFENMIGWTDDYQTPIIDLGDKTDAEKELLAKDFYKFYKNPKPKYGFRIDFQWESPLIGYLLSMISATNPKFDLKDYQESNCFFLKGKKITAGSISTAKTRFLRENSFLDMKDYIDEQFAS